MDAFLNNARASEDDNAVRQAHGTQAVSDDEGGAHPYRRDTRRCHEYPSDVHSEVFIALDPIRRCSEIRSRQRNSPIGLQIAPNRLVNLCREPMLNGYSPDCAAGAANRKVAPIARVRGFFVERRANMARFLRIRHVVKTDRAPMSKSRRFVGSSRTAAIGHSRKTRLFHRSRKELLFST